jgi:16S rRNA (uracil1498-N3)-methyltransferase
MRKIRIYQKGDYRPGQIITLSESASQHVGRVLRMKSEEEITLFDGNNNEYIATIKTIQKREVSVQIDSMLEISRESPLEIHLAQAISKGDKMEWLIQKAVELGVMSITPLLTSRCVVNLDEKRLNKKQQQWQSIAISACEQSGRNTIPTIYNPCSLTTFLKKCQIKNKLILSPDAEDSWRNNPNLTEEVALLIGPEGGLSEDEINESMKFQFQKIKLGPRVLRTETAAITSISIMQAMYGDL